MATTIRQSPLASRLVAAYMLVLGSITGLISLSVVVPFLPTFILNEINQTDEYAETRIWGEILLEIGLLLLAVAIVYLAIAIPLFQGRHWAYISAILVNVMYVLVTAQTFAKDQSMIGIGFVFNRIFPILSLISVALLIRLYADVLNRRVRQL